MGEIFGFLAKECGWTHEFILSNLTYRQVIRYYESIQLENLKNLRLETLSRGQAVAYGMGHSKKEEFEKFLDLLTGTRKDTKMEDPVAKMKKMNLPIEDN